MRTNYVLIDYENVQPAALRVLEKQHFKVFVFVGASQTKVAIDVAESLQRLGPSATYVRITGNGPNALDFHIAFYIGQIAATEPDAYFHVLSKDTGFDPLIAHLKARKILASRWKEVSEIPIVRMSSCKTEADKIAAIVANLRQRGPSRPRTEKTLASTISALFQKALPEAEVADLLHQMLKQGLIAVSGTRVTYSLPDTAG